MLAKLETLPADALMLDLEDGVPPDAKATARENLRRVDWAGVRRWMLRINAAGDPHHEADLELAEQLRAPCVVLPKVEDDLVVARTASRAARWGAKIGLMIETPAGLAKVDRLASHEGVEWLVYGSADLRFRLGARPDPDRGWERPAMFRILLAARVAGCLAIDAVHFRFRDRAGLTRAAEIARQMGFDGKSCIHPGQVATIHEVWAPTADEIAWAEQVVRSWREQQGASRGIVVVDGEMIEALHVRLAERWLARQGGR